MSLVEIARFQDVYEADLAAAFLASHAIEVSVTERFQTTVDPLMQRALGIRLMVPGVQADQARDLLARAGSGEFATDEGDDLPPRPTRTWAFGALMALAAFATGGFWGNSLPRRFRGVSGTGMLLAGLLFIAVWGGVAIVAKLLLDPP
ncbi:MAG: hypothetical protein KF910_10215 [Brevundimonas sp.]|uniref:hypothetical protein n=1 Tax=Brevundimonas sp. TaxID=1871086 RepID=UPI0025C4DD0A|nr:hypothetical protein [Brevundimonas sp.]MBX3477975.1 hypothetical protein [Brevundimonas sp.]